MRNYNQAPIPFMGQKRKFLRQFKMRLNECSPMGVYVDLFGGSGPVCESLCQRRYHHYGHDHELQQQLHRLYDLQI